MHPIISIVGRSNSGKTTLLEGLIPILKERGYRVAVVKHAMEDVEVDTVNKDTWRFSQAGSELSAINSINRLAVFKYAENDFSPAELSHFISWDYDLILTEGFKQSNYPKIEVHHKGQEKDLVSPPGQLLAVVTDEPLKTQAPQFSKDELQKLADLIEKTILAQQEKDDVDLLVNGICLPLNQSTKNLLTRTLVAMASGLNGIRDIKSLHISLRRKA